MYVYCVDDVYFIDHHLEPLLACVTITHRTMNYELYT